MKRKYEKPEIISEKMFEKTVLACLKCPGNSGSKCSTSTKHT